MEEKVLDTIKKYNLIEENDKVIVGVSGGPDSLALLNLLMNLKKQGKLKIELLVCHINHGLRKEADKEESKVKEFCHIYGIPCYTKKANINQIAKDRKCRYRRSRKNNTL